jgi:hypothetical protein
MFPSWNAKLADVKSWRPEEGGGNPFEGSWEDMNGALFVFISILLMLCKLKSGPGVLFVYCVSRIAVFVIGSSLPGMVVGALAFCGSRILINGLHSTLPLIGCRNVG